MAGAPLACVIGDMDLVRPLGMAGIRCITVSAPASPPWFSRFTVGGVPWVDPLSQPDELAEQLIERLVDFGLAQQSKPVLFYEQDWELLLVSRFRKRLGEAFRFVIPEADHVEAMVDKRRFQVLADQLGWPVPRGMSLNAASELRPDDVDLRFPILVKPMSRRTGTWKEVAESSGGVEAKVLVVSTREGLREVWPRVMKTKEDFLLQESIPGPESSIESYHAYIDRDGMPAGQFTGRKIRTYPSSMGYSTALTISKAQDVADLGRDLLHQLGFKGVAKIDFKRDADGHLHLLEINPRFTLWHHLGAHAGVNLPALVYDDLTGKDRGPAVAVRPGVRWCWLQGDARAAREQGMSWPSWLLWALTCEARANLAWDDPMPFLRGVLWSRLRGILPGRAVGRTVQ